MELWFAHVTEADMDAYRLIIEAVSGGDLPQTVMQLFSRLPWDHKHIHTLDDVWKSLSENSTRTDQAL